MLVFLSVVEDIVVFCPYFVVFAHAKKNFIMPGHYKKIMPAQQPIRARVLL